MAQKHSFYKKHRTLLNSNTVYNGQDVLKNHFLRKHPIHYTDDPADLSQVRQYDSTHVWLVDKKIETLGTFPWWFKPTENNTVYFFPCMYKDSWKTYSWESVQLVPTDYKEDYRVSAQKHVCGEYDMYRGKEHFDIFYLGDTASSVKDAQVKAETDMCWIVPEDVVVNQDFKFDFKPDYWSLDVCHVFENGEDYHDGIILISKYYNVSRNEESYRHYIKQKVVDIQASTPVEYDRFDVNDYYEYIRAARDSKTRFFWATTNEFDKSQDIDFSYYVPYYDAHSSTSTHVFKEFGKPIGLYLFSTESLVIKNEFDFKHFLRKVEVDLTV